MNLSKKEKRMYKVSTLRLVHAAVVLLAVVWIALSEAEVLPVHYLRPAGTTDYLVSLLSVATALGGTYLCLRLPALPRSRRQTQRAFELGDGKMAGTWRGVQLALLAVALWTNAVLYYATPYSPTPKYCLLIAFIAAVFCRPAAAAPASGSGGPDTDTK